MMRLSKYLAICGVASRRKADELIRAGAVEVNKKVVKAMGFRVDPDSDHVVCDGEPVEWPKHIRTVMLNKPPGFLTSVSDPHDSNTVMKFVSHYEERLYPVGRLDKDSEGLLLFTNDGELANRLAHPRYHLEKEYEVAIEGGPSQSDVDTLRKGIELDGEMTAKANIRFLGAKNKRRLYSIVLHEGRKRQIRRMFEEIGAKVAALRRVRVGPVRMGHLPLGAVREIKGPELKAPSGRCPIRTGPDWFE